MKFILGTANFGTPYGISNSAKKISNIEIKKILRLAKKQKISQLDTAINYKNSEKLLGKLTSNDDFSIITKLPKIGKNISLINNFIFQSLKKLKRKQLDGVLIHSIDDLDSINIKKIFLELSKLKKKKIIKNIGVSVYSVKNLMDIVDKYNVDIVQFPASVFDLRFLKEKILLKLKKKKIKILVRSIFLQGVIFLSTVTIKKKFKNYSKKIIKFREDLNNDTDKIIKYCLGFIKNFKYIDSIIIGVNSSNNLLQILNNNKKKTKIKNLNKYSITSEKILIPYNWKNIK
jgi:aryl-alcohol dehydrogenase-like predicted oxidoreductase